MQHAHQTALDFWRDQLATAPDDRAAGEARDHIKISEDAIARGGW
jgi:hypothetical protein